MDNLISVLTTVRNGAAFIEETLESVRNQTYTSYEHIIVDDGSTDHTVDIVRAYKMKHPQYPLRLFQPGIVGRGRALNFGVAKAKGDWIAILDADDLWHPKKIAIQRQCIIENINKIDVLATDGLLFSQSEEIDFSEPVVNYNVSNFRLVDFLRSNRISHSSVLIKKELCTYHENRESQYDYELWLRLSSMKINIAKIDLVLNFHRIHKNQSYEGKMGKIYRWRSFKLKTSYALKNRQLTSVIYNLLKLVFDMVFPRKVRLAIKKIGLRK